jgi:hypothetical protein
MNRISIFWHVAVTAVFCIVLPSVAPKHQPAKFVFGKFHTAADSAGITNPVYSLLLSALMSQFTLTVGLSLGFGRELNANTVYHTPSRQTSEPA